MTRTLGRWWRRWLIVTIAWAVPVMLVTVRDMQVQYDYNKADLNRSLKRWRMSDAQRVSGEASSCSGEVGQARAAGCPEAIVTANAPALQAAIDQYATRRHVLFSSAWQTAFGYWLAPSLLLLATGVLVAGVRRSLRRPPSGPYAVQSSGSANTPTATPPARSRTIPPGPSIEPVARSIESGDDSSSAPL
jgi:hypothetical protein